MHPNMTPYKVVIARGGTSKGIYIKQNELPCDPQARDRVIQAIFGSPDPRQIDGLGGADVLTSKLAIIGPSTREDADVDYTFAQVGFDSALVDFGGNCGNISAGVGPFAIDEGMVRAVEPVTTVRIHQTNTDCILIAEVETENGKAKVVGDAQIDGVPGTGSPIWLNFYDTAGATTGSVLPTGNPKDTVDAEGYGSFEVSIVDAGNVLVFIRAESLGLKGTESCAHIEADKELMAKIEAIRAAVTVRIGLAQTTEQATREHAYAPFFSIISKPAAYQAINGSEIAAEDTDLTARLYFMMHMHKAYPGTGAVATGAASRIEGTLVYELMNKDAHKRPVLRIGHPSGVMNIEAERRFDTYDIAFSKLSYMRTARRIMEGNVYVRNKD